VQQSPLEHYLAAVRPLLLARGHGAAPGATATARLWLGKGGAVLPERRLHACVCERTGAAFGRSVYPHLFRDAVATTIALDDPEHVRSAAAVLGHVSFASTERHYRMSRGADATRVLHDVMEALASDEDD
jgi:integrase/recombinase XerD